MKKFEACGLAHVCSGVGVASLQSMGIGPKLVSSDFSLVTSLSHSMYPYVNATIMTASMESKDGCYFQ